MKPAVEEDDDGRASIGVKVGRRGGPELGPAGVVCGTTPFPYWRPKCGPGCLPGRRIIVGKTGGGLSPPSSLSCPGVVRRDVRGASCTSGAR